MAHSISNRHDTSDENHDPYCDLCHEGRGLNVKVHCYCSEYVQHLCSDCHIIHGKLKSTKRHTLLWGDDMPKSHAAKPPRYEKCDLHPKLYKDQICSEHANLLCSSCCAEGHTQCVVRKVDVACRSVSTSEIDKLHDVINGYKGGLEKILSLIVIHREKITDQRKSMLNEVQKDYDSVLENLKKIFQNMKTDIESKCKIEAASLSKCQRGVTDIKARIEAVSSDVEKFKGKSMDAKIFLCLQEAVDDARERTSSFKSLSDSLSLNLLTFSLSKTIQDMLTSSLTFGSVCTSAINDTFDIDEQEIKFPFSSSPKTSLDLECTSARSPTPAACLLNDSGSSSTSSEDSEIESCDPLSKSFWDDCFCTGVVSVDDETGICVDRLNHAVNLFSLEKKSLSSVSVLGEPKDICLLSDHEAAVTVDKSLVILKIADSRLHIKETTPLSYKVGGIEMFMDKIAVICLESPPSVKIIDVKGKEYLSVSHDHQEQALFSDPCFVNSLDQENPPNIIVADIGTEIITSLNGDSGDVITRDSGKEINWLEAKGITVDTAGYTRLSVDVISSRLTCSGKKNL